MRTRKDQPQKEDKKRSQAALDLARKNIKLAIILGLVATAFYVGFILRFV